jgi:hypothetical protein
LCGPVLVAREACLDHQTLSSHLNQGVHLQPGVPLHWDHRFLITMSFTPVAAASAAHRYPPPPRAVPPRISFSTHGLPAGPHVPPADAAEFRVLRFGHIEMELLYAAAPDVGYLMFRYPREARYGLPVVVAVPADRVEAALAKPADRVRSVVAIPHVHYACMPGLHFEVEWHPTGSLLVDDAVNLYPH